MRHPGAALGMVLALACQTAEPAATDSAAADAGPPQTAPDASMRDVRIAPPPDAGMPEGRSTMLPPDAHARGDAACTVGQSQPCRCPNGAMGTQVCLTAEGQLSACGCLSATGPDILVPPPPPRVSTCGNTRCAPYPAEDTSTSARACCTMDGRCGSSSSFIFGQACVPRGGPKGTPNPACKDEFPNFLDLYGCCRPDGMCGLSIDQLTNFDLGCIERTEMARLLNEGSGERDFLSTITFLGAKKAEFQAVRCTP